MSRKHKRTQAADDEPSFWGAGPTPAEDRLNKLKAAVDAWRTTAIILFALVLFGLLILGYTLGWYGGSSVPCDGYYDPEAGCFGIFQP